MHIMATRGAMMRATVTATMNTVKTGGEFTTVLLIQSYNSIFDLMHTNKCCYIYIVIFYVRSQVPLISATC